MKLLLKLTEKTLFFIQIFKYKFVDFSQSMKVVSESFDLLKINERSPIIRLTEEFVYYNQIDAIFHDKKFCFLSWNKVCKQFT